MDAHTHAKTRQNVKNKTQEHNLAIVSKPVRKNHIQYTVISSKKMQWWVKLYSISNIVEWQCQSNSICTKIDYIYLGLSYIQTQEKLSEISRYPFQ